MVTQAQIDRINALSRKSKTVGLTEAERQEQTALRQLYINSVKASLVGQLDNTYIVDEKGNKRPLKKKTKTKLL